MPVWFAPILGASWVPVVRPDGVPGGVLPGLPVAVVNALVSFPPGAMGLALVPTRGVAAVAGPAARLGGVVGLLNPLALLNVCTRGLGAGRGGLSRGPANPLAAQAQGGEHDGRTRHNASDPHRSLPWSTRFVSGIKRCRGARCQAGPAISGRRFPACRRPRGLSATSRPPRVHCCAVMIVESAGTEVVELHPVRPKSIAATAASPRIMVAPPERLGTSVVSIITPGIAVRNGMRRRAACRDGPSPRFLTERSGEASLTPLR